jgi:hypothetical protein
MTPTRTHTVPAPRPLAPLRNAVEEGSAATFSWTSVPGAADYTIQIAHDPSFESSFVEVPAVRATSLTLYGVLPENRSRFYWRVGHAAGGHAVWSAPTTFTAAGEREASAFRAMQAARLAEIEQQRIASREAAVAALDLIPLCERSHTSRLQALSFFLSLALSMVALAVILARFA